MVFLTIGIRQSIGLFLKPVTADLGADRESFALALAAHNLILGLPLAAIAADSSGGYGPVRTAAVVLGIAAALIHLPNSVMPERSTHPVPAS